MKCFVEFNKGIEVCIYEDDYVYALYNFKQTTAGFNNMLSLLSGIEDLDVLLMLHPNISEELKESDVFMSSYGSKQSYLSEKDYDTLVYAFKLLTNLNSVSVISILDVIEHMESDSAYLFSSGDSIYAAAKQAEYVDDILNIPVSNANLYLNSLYRQYNFSYLENVDRYVNSELVSRFENYESIQSEYYHFLTMIKLSEECTAFKLSDLRSNTQFMLPEEETVAEPVSRVRVKVDEVEEIEDLEESNSFSDDSFEDEGNFTANRAAPTQTTRPARPTHATHSARDKSNQIKQVERPKKKKFGLFCTLMLLVVTSAGLFGTKFVTEYLNGGLQQEINHYSEEVAVLNEEIAFLTNIKSDYAGLHTLSEVLAE